MSSTADWYARAAVELADTSDLQRAWALGVASDPELLGRIDELPREHRQPSLLFSIARWCGAPAAGYGDWREWVVAHWEPIAAAATRRRTQTNEVGRCIPLLLGLDVLARRTGEAAFTLLELGAAAGLCLGVERYSYRFDDAPVLGTGSPLLTTSTTGGGVAPTRMPSIAWRAGIDLAPLDTRAPDDLWWLESLLPPDRPERLARLRAAVATLRDDPPHVVAGDALAELPALAATVPAGLPLVVASLGTAVYLPPADRAALPDAVAAVGGHLVAFEPTTAIPGIAERLRDLHAPAPTSFVLSVDGEPIAHAGAHGDRVSWLSAGHPGLPAAPA